MRVLLVNDFYIPYMVGGAETLVDELVAGLSARGHEVAIVTARLQGLPARDTATGVSIFRIGRFPAFGRARRLASGSAPGLLSPATIADFQAVMAEFNPDVVHFHNVWLLGPEIVHQASVRRGITLHDYWPICVRRTMIRVSWKPCPGPAPIACRLCRLRAPATWGGFDLAHIERERSNHMQVLQSCDFVTAPSRYLASQIQQISTCQLNIVYNGVRSEIATLRKKADYVLFGSRPVSTKGYNIAIRAFARPDLESHELVVAGDASDTDMPNIHILGHQPSSQMPELIAQATCVIVPSLWPENCPMIILEALRAGVPIVASRIGGIPELIEEGVTGVLVPPGDVDALASAIRRCVEDEKLQASARKHGPEAVKQRFSLDIMISQLESVYAA